MTTTTKTSPPKDIAAVAAGLASGKLRLDPVLPAHGATPHDRVLVWAAQNRRPDLVEELLALGCIKKGLPEAMSAATLHADIRMLTALLTVATDDQAAAAMVDAAVFNQTEAAKMLLPAAARSAKVTHVMYAAALRGRSQIVEMLIQALPETTWGDLPLILASEAHHVDTVKLLLPHADPKANNSQALRYAARSGHLELVQLLLPRSDPTAKQSEALWHATEIGNHEMFKLLLPLSRPNAGSYRSLRNAAAHGRAEMVAALLTHAEQLTREFVSTWTEKRSPQISAMIQAHLDNLALRRIKPRQDDPSANSSSPHRHRLG